MKKPINNILLALALLALSKLGAPALTFTNYTYSVGARPCFAAAADIYGNGKLALISANSGNGSGDTLTLLTNNGSGIFGFNATLAVGINPQTVVAADVNGDGKVDIICGNDNQGSLTVLTNNGTGVFGFNATLPVGQNPQCVTAADVNGDGKVDLISANNYFNTLTVLTNNGSGGFGLSATLNAGITPWCVIAADVNGDGKPDLICANAGDTTLTVYTNNGSGAFSLSATLTVGPNPRGVIAVDINGDGSLDLISANYGNNTLTVLTNNGAGVFGLSATITTVGSQPFSVATADVNGDGKPDLICANNGSASLTVLTNNGGGGFGYAATLNVGNGPYCVLATNLDNDGRLDLVCVNNLDSTMSVLTQMGSPASFNAVSQFSITNGNPNGSWSYGILSSFTGGTFTLLDNPLSNYGFPGEIRWNNNMSQPDSAQIFANPTGNPATFGSILAPTNQLDMDGQSYIADVRWTAPYSGNFNVAGLFQRNDDGGYPVSVRIIQNGATELFGADNFTTYLSQQPFNLNLSLSAGTVLDFAEGAPQFYNDTTGLQLVISPSALSLEFTASPTNGAAPLAVQFAAPAVDSQGNSITQWNWNFGDGATSAAQNPSHMYTTSGVFTPSLVATNDLGQTVPGFGPSITVSNVLADANLVLNGGFETGDFTDWTQSGNLGTTFVSTTPPYVHSGSFGAQLGPVGSLGYLTQTIATQPGAAYVLSCWLASPDGETPNAFLVNWNGGTIFSATNLPAFGWTNLQFVVAAAGSSSVLQFGFLDNPSYLGLDDISLVAVPGLAPTIATQPQSQFVDLGNPAAFGLSVMGAPPFSYQWQFNGTNLADGGNLSGSLTSNLVLSATSTNDGGNYTVIVTNAYGSVTSSVAKLTLIIPNVITFDDLPDTGGGTAITNGYFGLTWSNVFVLDVSADSYGTNSGYYAGLASPPNDAYNGYGTPASISNGQPFNLLSGYFTAAWNDNLQLQAEGFAGNTLVYSNTYTLSATQPSLINFNYYRVNEVYFNSFGGTQHGGYTGGGEHFAMDNLNLGSSFPVRLKSTTWSGNNVQFSWSAANTYPTVSYQVQYTTNLVAPNWVNLGAAQATTTFTDTPSSDAQRFYRVQLIQ